MDFFVYILYSKKLEKFYIGTTDNVERRLNEHNNGHYESAFTSKGIPWELFLSITCEDSNAAYKLERFIKQMKSSAFIKRIKSEPTIIDSIREQLKSGGIGIPKPRERKT